MVLADTRFLTRRRKLAAELAGQRVDAMLVTNLIHVRYFSNFSGSNGALLINKDLSASIATDGRYATQIAQEVPDIEAVIGRQCGETLLSRVEGPRRVGFEADYVSVSELEAFKEAAGDGVELVPVSGALEDIRITKDPLELERLRWVARIAADAFTTLIQSGELAVGRTERDVAADLELHMRRNGAERTSFDTIVASGTNSALPHHTAGERIIKPGDIVTLDFGAFAAGFNSDMTRTVVMGQTDSFAKEIFDLVHRAQAAGIAAATAGTSLSDVDAAAREVIEDAGMGEYFVHSTGHGVGLEVHEAPYASTTGKGVLKPDMTLTIEPGVYVPNKGGVRIEDTLVITEGDPEIITNIDRDLLVL